MSPLIKPPTDENVPYAMWNEVRPITKEQWDRIEALLSLPNWKCPKCGAVVVGWCKVCPYNYNKLVCGYVREKL